MRPLGDGFIKLVKMLIAPIVFTTVVVGIAHMGAMKEVGRIGLRALLYFEVVSTLALVIGLVVVNVLQPGSGLTIDPATARHEGGRRATPSASKALTHDRLPPQHHSRHRRRRLRARRDPAGAAVLGAVRARARCRSARRVAPLVALLSISCRDALFAIVGIIMRLAPIGAFGAMAFTVGRYGIGIAALARQADGRRVRHLPAVRLRRARRDRRASTGFSLIKFLKYISEEILIVLGTSSSESALPRIMAKLERLGCAEAGRRPGGADRLLVQSRRHVDLHDDGGDVRGAGERRAPVARPAAVDARRSCC